MKDIPAPLDEQEPSFEVCWGPRAKRLSRAHIHTFASSVYGVPITAFSQCSAWKIGLVRK